MNPDFSHIKAIVIGGSAGSLKPVTKILANLSPTLSIPVFLCLHRLKHISEGFVEVLNIYSAIKVTEPHDKEQIKGGIAYLAPSNYHMYINKNFTISLSTEELVNYSRPAIDLSFYSASDTYSTSILGIILSGANKDGAKGMKYLIKNGGSSLVQSIEDSQIPTMPEETLTICKPDLICDTDKITDILSKLK